MRLVEAWRDRWLRVLAHPGFQRWAARFPLTRPVARRRANALFDLCAGFVYSQVLFACVRVGLLEALAEGPATAEALAPRIGLSVEATKRLLDAATSLALVERRPRARYALGIHGASYVGNPSIAALVEHHAMLYRDLEDPVALLRGERPETELGRFWAYGRDEGTSTNADAVAPYSELMASSLTLLAEDVLEAYPVRRHRRALDVGGGQGAFVTALARRAPALELGLFDLPPVAERAARRLATEGLGDRVRVTGGDVFRDPLPGPVDLLSLVRILHDHDEDDVRAILAAAHEALEPGGTLLVAEPMRDTRGAEPMGDAYFGFYLLAMGRGRPRSPAELRALLEEAGFERVQERATRRPMLTQLLVARRGTPRVTG